MATSTGKTIGLILLVALIFLIITQFTPLAVTPLAFIPGLIGLVRGSHILGLSQWANIVPHSVLSTTLIVIWLVVVIWVYRDAERRGMNGILWALLVFIGNIIGLVIYLILRSSNLASTESTTVSCPGCEKPLTGEYAYCPYCGIELQAKCPACEKPIQPDWQVCPHCGKKLTEKK